MNGETATVPKSFSWGSIKPEACSLNHNPDSGEAPVDRLASELSDGLKSCRTLVDDYRAKLSGQSLAPNGSEPDPPEQLAREEGDQAGRP
jgi:hypothetical protein